MASRFLVVGLLASALVISSSDQAQAVGTISLDVSYRTGTSVPAGEKVDLTAQMPVVGPGTVQQTIEQAIDPTKLKLTSAADVIYPNNWTLSVSFDGNTFTASLPNSATGTATSWDKVTKVRATGPVESEGTDAGLQVAVAASSAQGTASIFRGVTSSGGGDGVRAFFDPGYTRIFDVNHKITGKAVLCYIIATAQPCDPTGNNLNTSASNSTNSETYGMVVKDKLWQNSQSGVICTDLSPMYAGTGLTQPCDKEQFWSGKYLAELSPRNIEGSWKDIKIWTFEYGVRKALCVDTATMIECPLLDFSSYLAGSPVDLLASGNKVYLSSSGGTDISVVMCLKADGSGPCDGWSSGSRTLPGFKFLEIPDVNGVAQTICTARKNITAKLSCWDATNGVSKSPPSSFSTVFAATTDNTGGGYLSFNRIGTRIVWGQGNIDSGPAGSLGCWDASLNSGSGGDCNPSKASLRHYTAIPDPQVKGCMWVVGHYSPILTSINLNNPGTNPSSSPNTCAGMGGPAMANFGAEIAVPRMACNSDSPIAQWRSLTVTTPTTGFDSAVFTIFNESGEPVPGWTDLPLTQQTNTYSLTGLSVNDTGQKPRFQIKYLGAAAGAQFTPTIRISALGESPELCISPEATVICPALPSPAPAPGIWPTTVSATTSSVTASGQAVDSNNVTTASPAETKTVDISGITGDACGGAIRGTASSRSLGIPVPGMKVELLTSGGAVVNGTNGLPLIATTDAQGNYSFGNLAPGSYKVRYTMPTDMTGPEIKAVYSDTGSGVAGTTTSGASAFTTGVVAVAQNQTDVINPEVANNAFAVADSSVGAVNQQQIIRPLDNDLPYYGGTPGDESLSLCPAVTTSATNCNASTVTVANQGTYTVVGKTIVFTPVAGFTGDASPIRYRFSDGGTDSWKISTALVSVKVLGSSTASPDTSTGAFGEAQIASVISNDSPVAGSQVDPSSVKLCGPGDSAPSCTQSSLSVAGVGTYTAGSGSIIFKPAAGFSGTPQPVTYSALTTANGPLSSTYTPTVTAPASIQASNDAISAVQGFAKTVNPLTNDQASTGATLDPTSVFLCGTGQTSPACDKRSLTTVDGVYTVNATTGIVSFTPNVSTLGTLSPVTYQISDTAGQTVSARITATVYAALNAVNDISEGTFGSTQVLDLLANDVKDQAATLLSSSVKLCSSSETAPSCSATSLTTSDGTYSLSGGVVTFVPATGFVGQSTPPVTYQVTDSFGITDSATFTAKTLPLASPTGVNDTSSGLNNVNQIINVLINDQLGADTSIVQFSNSSLKLCPTSSSNTGCTLTSLTVPNEGTYTVDSTNGQIVFDPLPQFVRDATPVRYYVQDTAGGSTTALITPTVFGLPVAANDSSTGPWNTVQPIDLLSNDQAGYGVLLNEHALFFCDTSPVVLPCDKTELVVQGIGTYKVLADHTVTFTPVNTFTGNAPAVTYSVSDDRSQVTSAQLRVSVNAPPAPVAVNDALTSLHDVNQTYTPSNNDTASGSGTFSFVATSVKLCNFGQLSGCALSTLSVPNQGTYTVNSDGTVLFDPLPAFSGVATPVLYEIADTSGQTATATLTPNIKGLPSIDNETTTGAWNQVHTIDLSAGDTAGFGTTLNTSSVRLCGPSETPPLCTQTTLTVTGVGTYVLNSGNVTFTPVASFSGTAAPVTYSITDSENQRASGTYTAIVSMPLAPSAQDEEKPVLPGQSVTFTAITGTNGLATGSQLQTSGQNAICLVASSNTTPSSGCVTSLTTVDGSWVITPASGLVVFTASNSVNPGSLIPVDYRVTDAVGQNAQGTLSLSVPQPPQAQADTSRGAQDATQFISVLGNDQPGSAVADLDPTSVKLCAPGATSPCTQTSLTVAGQGTYTVLSSGIVKFVPQAGWSGTTAPLGYSAEDILGQRINSTITVTVVPPPFPIALVDTGNAAFGQTVTFKPWLNDDGGVPPAGEQAPNVIATSIKLCGPAESAPSCSQTTVTTNDGTYVLNVSTGEVVFSPATGFVGTATAPVSYQISNDWSGPSGIGTATSLLIPTIAPPGAPLSQADVSETAPGVPVEVDPLANDVAGSASLNRASIVLCSSAEIAPQCTQRTVTVREGTFSVDPNTGRVTFTPNENFGPSSPAQVTYAVQDGNQLWTFATITIVDPPAASTVGQALTNLAQTGMGLVGGPLPFTALSALAVGATVFATSQFWRYKLMPVFIPLESSAVYSQLASSLNKMADPVRSAKAVDREESFTLARPPIYPDGRPD